MRLFDELNIETQADCNRACPTCLRQSYPGRIPMRQGAYQMPSKLVYGLLDQAAGMEFRGRVCLQHFNEPLLDDRIEAFGRYAKSKKIFSEVYLNTNGDRLTETLAGELDGAFDRLHIALYAGDKVQREAQYRSWFRQTKLTFTQGEHVVTHFSPFTNLADEVAACQTQPCERECQMRCVIVFSGEMQLCCDDIGGQFALGSAWQRTLANLWFGEPHRSIVEQLRQPGGRQQYPYCQTCPRHNTPYWSAL
jgi:hypothetical protein